VADHRRAEHPAGRFGRAGPPCADSTFAVRRGASRGRGRDGLRLRLVRPDATGDNIALPGPDVSFAENPTRTEAAAFPAARTDPGTPVLRLHRESDGWHPTGDRTLGGNAGRAVWRARAPAA
jgi:hypothetical protein